MRENFEWPARLERPGTQHSEETSMTTNATPGGQTFWEIKATKAK